LLNTLRVSDPLNAPFYLRLVNAAQDSITECPSTREHWLISSRLAWLSAKVKGVPRFLVDMECTPRLVEA